MTIGYPPPSPAAAVHKLKGPLRKPGLRRFVLLLRLYARPVTVGKPMGVHLPDRVWRRQSALLMCLHDLQQTERVHE